MGTGVTAVNTSIWQIDLVTDYVQALGHAMLKWLVSVCVRCSFRLDFVSYLNEILKERAPPLLCLQEQEELCAVAFPLRDPKRRRTPELLVRSDLQVGAAVHESSCRECMALEGSVVQRCESTVSGAAEDLRVDIERCAAEQILHDACAPMDDDCADVCLDDLPPKIPPRKPIYASREGRERRRGARTNGDDE